MKKTFASLARDLSKGRTTSQALVEQCLAAIGDANGEGARAFIHVNEERAREEGCAADKLRAKGVCLSPYAGIPVSVKDLFDVAGEITRAGSVVLEDKPPALHDAAIVARLRGAGLVVIGRTNMSEFAFTGVGVNPHYGTPAAPWDRSARRIPGGSSSGAAISVSDDMAFGAIGTDTGGSCRIPAAFSGLVGYKPTASRIPLDGTVPLSTSLDSVGCIANSVDCCATIDAILAGTAKPDLADMPLQGLRILVPANFVIANLDEAVSRTFERALEALGRAGAVIVHRRIDELDNIPTINALGGFPAAESYAWHRQYLETLASKYDPQVRVRIERGKGQSAADYIDLRRARAQFIAGVEKHLVDFDAMVMPTVPIVPPRIDDLTDDDVFAKTNLLILRNPAIVNLLDGCAISLPIHSDGDAPVGLMVVASNSNDQKLFRTAASVASLFAGV